MFLLISVSVQIRLFKMTQLLQVLQILFQKVSMNISKCLLSERHSKPSKTYKMQLFVKIVNGFSPKKTGGLIGPPNSGFSKNVFFRERVKDWFFVAFDIIISHIFSEKFIEIPCIFQKI